MDGKVIKIVNEARWADGLTVRDRLENITNNPMRTQVEFVRRLVRENAKSEYRRRMDSRGFRSPDGVFRQTQFGCH